MGKLISIQVEKSLGCLSVALSHNAERFSLKQTAVVMGFLCFLIVNLPSFSPLYAVPLLIVLAWLLCKALLSVREENLLIVKGLGYQTCSKFAFRKTALYIPYEQVQKVFINEVILRHKVVHVLSLIVHEGSNQQKLIPLFTVRV
ncbi:hypothetical protein HUJ05_007090 [Dendroctonus ponderosae]|nr:hypothetical protein HUJ05_007090 [Dendroctonus ponderosae]